MRAYAVVFPGLTPTFEVEHTKNFVSITHINPGVYCLFPAPGIDFSTGAVVVGLDLQHSQLDGHTNVLEVYDYPDNSDCGGGIEIITIANPQSGGGASDGIAFTLVLT